MKYTDTRKAIIDALESRIGKDVFYSDGRPAVLEEGDFLTVAVSLTDVGYIGEELDADIWQATLHIKILLPAQIPNSEPDDWIESCIYPALSNASGLSLLINNMVQQGYNHQCGDDFGLWSPASLKCSIICEM